MYFRVKAKIKKTTRYRELKGITLLAVSFLYGYCVVMPDQSGEIGRFVANISFQIFGKAVYIAPLLLAWAGIMYLKTSLEVRARLDAMWSALILSLGASFMSMLWLAKDSSQIYLYGGWVGSKLSPFFFRLFGTYLSLAILLALFAYASSLLLRISLRELAIVIWGKLVEDYRQWQEARKDLAKVMPPKIRPNLEQKPKSQAPVFQSKPEQPKIISPQKPVSAPFPDRKPPAQTFSKPVQQELPVTAPVPVEYKLPGTELLSEDKIASVNHDKEEHLANAELLTRTLKDFNVEAKVIEIIPGPVVTRYDMELAPGTKIQAVVALSENIALSMKSPSVRVVSIPEKAAVGVEVPNSESSIVGLKGILQSQDFQNSKSLLTLAFGKTTDGIAYVSDLAPMPHLLIAGATGSGKSVGIHSIILSVLYKARPDEVKFMLIDPKRLEMPVYKGLPHMYDPRVSADKADIITQPKEAAESLKRLVKVMEARYEKFAKAAVRNIEGYNEKMTATGGIKEFYILVIIDELADLMLIATREVEDSIQRLAQMARAVGIHLILATQRPSVDVITGVIKANFPARIAFQTTSKVDSRVILDAIGADALLGKGDMLFLPSGEAKPIRLQGAFVSVKEAERVVDFIKKQNIAPSYENVAAAPVTGPGAPGNQENTQDLVAALKLVQERKRVSQDLLKAHFGSSARATNLLSILEMKGFIHKPEGTNRWTIYFEKITDYLGSAGQEEQA